MAILLGVDLGTTKITALALDTASGDVVARAAALNQAETTVPADKARGWSEWDADKIVATACSCLHELAVQLGERRRELAGLGITGQQHGVLLVNAQLEAQTPLINWQDRRGEQAASGSQTYVQLAVARAGADVPRRTGCRLAAGYMGVTLFWMQQTGVLPSGNTACFLMDYFAARISGHRPVTDPTCAASSGLLDVASGNWDPAILAALQLPSALFPEVWLSGACLGGLTASAAADMGLPVDLPVFLGMGDNQASFLGSVGDPADAVLVNVGTGGQVAVYAGDFDFDPLLETRPFPRGGFLLVSAGLAGGAAYAVLERFFRQVGMDLFNHGPGGPLYARLNELAAQAPPGASGLRCDPFFGGTRAQPYLRAALTGLSTENFTPAHLSRALLEGMAQTFFTGYQRMIETGIQRRTRLIGAGNGLRENPVLAALVADAFAQPLTFPRHREEAACGAALLAAVGAGLFPDVRSAGQLLRIG